jgi:hypothetical protein
LLGGIRLPRRCSALTDGTRLISFTGLGGEGPHDFAKTSCRAARPLRQILDEMARATDTENWANLVALDMKIHEAVYQLADSPMLLKVWETLRIGVFPLNESVKF